MNKGEIDTDIISDVINSCDDTKNNTLIGAVNGFFANNDKIKEIGAVSVSDVFNKLKEEVADYYA